MKQVALSLMVCVWVAGCDQVSSLLEQAGIEVVPPTAQLRQNGVVLEESPEESALAAWYCHDFAESTLTEIACQTAFGSAPAEESLKFSFDSIYDLGNANTFPVPMVEILVAIDVFEGRDQSELGAVCVSFCDPESGEDCAAGANPDACRLDDPTGARTLDDFSPTVDDLIAIATDVAVDAATGDLDTNLSFRVIPSREERTCRTEPSCEARDVDGVMSLCCGDDCVAADAGCDVGPGEGGGTCVVCPGELEAHVRFDLGIRAILGVLGTVVADSIDALLAGRAPDFDIPYALEGTLFFDVPVLGRFAISFGPVQGVFSID
jgi:hypothetical protein